MYATTTGTTIVALKFNNSSGIVFAADKQCTSNGFMSMHAKGFQKLHKISNQLIVAYAGSVSGGQYFVRILKYNLRQYRLEHNQELRSKAIANIASIIIKSICHEEDSIAVVIGTYDPIMHGTELFSIGSDGSIISDDFVSTGSGSFFSYPYIKARYDKTLNTEAARTLAENSIRLSSSIDVFSGIGVDCAILTEQGIEMFETEPAKPLKLHEL